MNRWNRNELKKRRSKSSLDILDNNLMILFCGINPGLYSAAVGHNFARPGNRFWKALAGADFTNRIFAPDEELMLLSLGYGITNIVDKPTARADELETVELLEGAEKLKRRVLRYKPRVLAVLGITAYRTAFESPKARPGLQEKTIGKTKLWVLPNTSGLNANHQLPDLILCFEALRSYASKP